MSRFDGLKLLVTPTIELPKPIVGHREDAMNYALSGISIESNSSIPANCFEFRTPTQRVRVVGVSL